MLEKLLGKWGFRVYVVVAVCLVAYLFWATIANHGIPGRFNMLQARLLGGVYYVKLTVMLLFIPALLVAWFCGVVVDWLTGQGLFRRREPESVDGNPG